MSAEKKDEQGKLDTLFNGTLQCLQNKPGYRFSVDAVLLAHFIQLKKNEKILDLCCGSGIIGLILLYRFSDLIQELSGLELQESLSSLAQENIRLNRFEEKMKVYQGDFRQILNYYPAESFTSVICNPPFYSLKSGRPSENLESHAARHQVNGSLAEVCAAAALVVKNRGKVCLIYPADKIVELFASLRKCRLIPKKLQYVYSYQEPFVNARLLLVEAVKNGGEQTHTLEPFYIYEKKNGHYSKAMARSLSENSHFGQN